MKTKWIATIAATLSAAAGVQAQTALPAYVEAGYTALEYRGDGLPGLKLGAARAIVGLAVHPNVAVEAVLATGLKSDTVQNRSIEVTAKVDNLYGVFVKPRFNPLPQLELFGRLGYVKTRLKASVASLLLGPAGQGPGSKLREAGSEGDAAYGIGLACSFAHDAYLSADYLSYFDKDGAKAGGVSLGVGFRF